MSLGEEGNQSNDVTVNKVVLVGDENVGKTSMFLRFKTDRFIETTSSTRYQAEHYKEWTVNGLPVKMTLYDTAGMERYTSTIPPTYFRHAHAVILVYSVDNDESIGNVKEWMDNFSANRIGDSCHDMKVLLVGNKIDITDDSRTVTEERIRETAKICGLENENQLYQISTKEGTNFDQLFDTLALAISTTTRPRRKTIRAGEENENSSSEGGDGTKKKFSCSKCS